MVFLFASNMILPFCQKNEGDPLPKNILKDDIYGIIVNIVFLLTSDRKMKDDKKVYLVKYT